jgi:hypothetical protein
VWQGSAGDRRPYADQTGLWEVLFGWSLIRKAEKAIR